MPDFKKPNFDFNYSVASERKNFRKFFKDRKIPKRGKNEFDLASWNIANLGTQKRRDKDLKLIAEILSHFNIIAVQEVKAQLDDFMLILKELNKIRRYGCVFTDVAGNNERLAVVYRESEFEPMHLAGELDYNPNGRVIKGRYTMPGQKFKVKAGKRKIPLTFYNFNRNPFLSSWRHKKSGYQFVLANVHIYWGDYEKKNKAKFYQRVAEVYYLAEWARTRRLKKNAKRVYEPNVILLGDMNIPSVDPKDPVFAALKRKGMRPTSHASQAGTTLQEFYRYDQLVFSDNETKIREINGADSVVVDFDNFVFPTLWKKKTVTQFKAWTKFTISDHRPIFVRVQGK